MFFNFTWLYWCSLMFTSVICCHMAHPLIFTLPSFYHPPLVTHPPRLPPPLALSFRNPSVPLLSRFWESLAHPKSASCRGLWEPMESPWPGMQAGSHGNAGMWGVWGDKSCEPSQGEARSGGGRRGRVRRVRQKQGEQQVCEWGNRNTTP